VARLRTKQLASGLITGTAVTDVYTVPAGYRTILKTVQLLEASGVACQVNVRLSGVGAWEVVSLAAYPASGASANVKQWVVFEPGQVLQLNRSNAGTYTYILSGSEMLI
jgi:hypothetical protein